MNTLPIHPTLNASLNGLAALFIVGAIMAIKANKRELHKKLMLSAVATSTAFLISYLVYHYSSIATKFSHEGTIRTFYYTLLASHVILAVVILPLIFLALRHALKENWVAHKKIVHWAAPLWLYVSVTGVLVYLMLYVWYPAANEVLPAVAPAVNVVQ